MALQDARALDALNLEETAMRRVQLEALVEHGENNLRRLRHQVDLLRAAHAVSRGEEAMRAQGTSPLGIPTAIDSAELLRARRAAAGDRHAPSRARPFDSDDARRAARRSRRRDAIAGRRRARAPRRTRDGSRFAAETPRPPQGAKGHAMNEFLVTALTFPTVVYGVLLAVCIVYWLLAATGLVDHHGPDALFHADTGHVGHSADHPHLGDAAGRWAGSVSRACR